jgi:hypothetical protein
MKADVVEDNIVFIPGCEVFDSDDGFGVQMSLQLLIFIV